MRYACERMSDTLRLHFACLLPSLELTRKPSTPNAPLDLDIKFADIRASRFRQHSGKNCRLTQPLLQAPTEPQPSKAKKQVLLPLIPHYLLDLHNLTCYPDSAHISVSS